MKKEYVNLVEEQKYKTLEDNMNEESQEEYKIQLENIVKNAQKLKTRNYDMSINAFDGGVGNNDEVTMQLKGIAQYLHDLDTELGNLSIQNNAPETEEVDDIASEENY